MIVHVPAEMPVTSPDAVTPHGPDSTDQVGDPTTVGFVPDADTVVEEPTMIDATAGLRLTVGADLTTVMVAEPVDIR